MAVNRKVFVVQKQMRMDPQTGDLVPKFDISTAEQYGDIEYLLSPSASPFNPKMIIAELHEKLKEITDRDYLVLLGNPALIGLTCAIAAEYTEGNLNLLQWSGKAQSYALIPVDNLFAPGN